MSDSSAIDAINDPNAAIIQPKHRGRLDPNSLDAPREAKRRRGAPKGNRNALRHGFYAKNLGLNSPSSLDEKEMRNLLGEAAMLKDYMYILYTCNLEIRDAAVLAETLRALSMAGMALSRLLLVHSEIRVTRSSSSSTLSSLLTDMGSATNRANRLASSFNASLDDEDED